ncbi:MAG: hypothetical protein WCL51_13460 [Bacteroidota bacterium]
MKKAILFLVVISLFLCSANVKENNKYAKYENKEDTICRVSRREIEKRWFFDTVIVCACPTKVELDSLNLESEYLKKEKNEFNNAVAFLKRTNLRNYLVFDTSEVYNFIVNRNCFYYSKSNSYKIYKKHWYFIFFDGNKDTYSTVSDSLEGDYMKYFEPPPVKVETKTYYIKRN